MSARYANGAIGYFGHNVTTGHAPAGVPLSGADLVLHQLWPLGGASCAPSGPRARCRVVCLVQEGQCEEVGVAQAARRGGGVRRAGGILLSVAVSVDGLSAAASSSTGTRSRHDPRRG
ncbi:MOSC domain-containing protein [Actinokineospora sp. NPDC004072]